MRSEDNEELKDQVLPLSECSCKSLKKSTDQIKLPNFRINKNRMSEESISRNDYIFYDLAAYNSNSRVG